MNVMIDVNASLFDNLRQTRGLWFGVIDGAQCGDIVTALAQTPLQSRPLYIGLEQRKEQLNTAPFLVALNSEGATSDSFADEALIRHCFDVAKIPSACVFWHCNAGGDALYHHLRSINKIIVPQMKDDVIADTATETVLFRHADANVMAQVLPAVNAVELSRLLGVAEFILVRPSDEWGGSLLYVARTADMPEPQRGSLQLSPQTYQQIILNRQQGIINKIEIFLDKFADKSTQRPKPSPQELKRIARESYIEARKNGVNSEGGFNHWAWFYYASQGKFTKDVGVQNYIRDERHGSVDRGLASLINESANSVLIFLGRV